MAFPVAVIQPTVEPGAVDENRHTVTRMTAEAAASGAKLIVLPEACISDIFREAASLAEPVPGPSTETLARVAGDAVIALPLLEKDGQSVYSSCVFVSKDGVRGIARKTHLFRDPTGHDSFLDKDVVAPGDKLGLIALEDLNVGVLLGFDAEFPEAFRALALRGADLIIAAVNCIEPDLRFLSAMALRNRIPVLVSNRIGFRKVYPAVPEFTASMLSLLQDKDGTFIARCKGGSAILDEGGRAIVEPKQEAQRELDAMAGLPERAMIPRAHFQLEDILTASFRIDELRVQRLTSPYLSERREDLYGLPAEKSAAKGKGRAAKK